MWSCKVSINAKSLGQGTRATLTNCRLPGHRAIYLRFLRFFLQAAFPVVQRREMDSMACGNVSISSTRSRSDESSSLGERLETALQGKGHAFEQASMGHVREWMPIQNSAKIRRRKSIRPRSVPVRRRRLWRPAYPPRGASFSGSPHRK